MATVATPPDIQTQGMLTPELVSAAKSAFVSQPQYRQAMNAVCVTPVSKVALNRERVVEIDHTFSHHLPENKITAQMQSGRCWMFAALNTFRVEAIRNMNLDNDFELSQNYMTFWDKFEKANYFLESILTSLDEPTGSRLLDWLLSGPVQDGGQWHMFINLVKKYGVVPKKAMPETESSSSTREMSYHLTHMLRDFACSLRKAYADGASLDMLRQSKKQMVEESYRILAIHLGVPPEEFAWQWRDKDKGFHRDERLTPQEFFTKYVKVPLDEMVCLVHDPRPQHPYNQVYTVSFLGNVVGGEPIKYLNVPIDVLKQAAVAQIRHDQPVWFGNDVGKHLDRDLGAMDLDLFDFDLVYGTSPSMQGGAAHVRAFSDDACDGVYGCRP